MDYVYSINLGNVFWIDGAYVKMTPGDVWFADDPFVVARPALFSATPPAVHSTVGRKPAECAPLDVAPTREAVGATTADVVGATEDLVRRGRGRRAS